MIVFSKLKEWEESGIDKVILKAEGGKAFCAGGKVGLLSFC